MSLGKHAFSICTAGIYDVEDELTVMSSRNPDSNTDIAASEPEPIVANGSVSVEPCGYTCIVN